MAPPFPKKAFSEMFGEKRLFLHENVSRFFGGGWEFHEPFELTIFQTHAAYQNKGPQNANANTFLDPPPMFTPETVVSVKAYLLAKDMKSFGFWQV